LRALGASRVHTPERKPQTRQAFFPGILLPLHGSNTSTWLLPQALADDVVCVYHHTRSHLGALFYASNVALSARLEILSCMADAAKELSASRPAEPPPKPGPQPPLPPLPPTTATASASAPFAPGADQRPPPTTTQVPTRQGPTVLRRAHVASAGKPAAPNRFAARCADYYWPLLRPLGAAGGRSLARRPRSCRTLHNILSSSRRVVSCLRLQNYALWASGNTARLHACEDASLVPVRSLLSYLAPVASRLAGPARCCTGRSAWHPSPAATSPPCSRHCWARMPSSLAPSYGHSPPSSLAQVRDGQQGKHPLCSPLPSPHSGLTRP